MKRVAVALAVAMLATGCGDPDLWSRWRAERALFHARRAAIAAAARGPAVPARERERAEAALEAITRDFPASRWGAPPDRGPARDVARASARASVLLARLAAQTGDPEEALARWRLAREDWAVFAEVRAESHAGAARALDRLGRLDESLEERLALARLDPLGDLEAAPPMEEVLAAPQAVADELRLLGRAEEARALLLAAESRFAAALARAPADRAPRVAEALARLRVALGDVPGALAAMRVTLPAVRAWEVPTRALGIAGVAFGAAAYDSTLAYARWASSASNNREVAGPALLLTARAWEAKGVPDSALAAYRTLFERWSDPGEIGPEAHFWRAGLLERLGQWERARAELASLAAAAPDRPFAFQAALQVVRHHLREGEYELARLEGRAAVERLEYLLATDRDPRVQRQAGLVRADLLLELGFAANAESSLVDLWRRFPEDSATESAALRGASLAEHRPGGRAVAGRIYDDLARTAARPEVRRAAAGRRASLGLAAPPSGTEDRP